MNPPQPGATAVLFSMGSHTIIGVPLKHHNRLISKICLFWLKYIKYLKIVKRIYYFLKILWIHSSLTSFDTATAPTVVLGKPLMTFSLIAGEFRCYISFHLLTRMLWIFLEKLFEISFFIAMIWFWDTEI